MTNIEKLQSWVEEEKKNNGLIDIKLFPSEYVVRKLLGLPAGSPPEIDLEAIAGDVLALLSGTGEDITNQKL